MITPSLTYRQIFLSYLSWWLFWIIIQTLVLHRLNLSWQTSLTDATVSNVLLAIAGYITENTYRFYQPGSKSRLYRFVYCIVLTIIYIAFLKWILKQLFSDEHLYLTFLEASLPVRFMFSTLIIAFMAVISWLWHYTKEQEELKSRKDDAEKLLKEAELASLRQQLQPHFLFNSLNSISALAGSRPEEARKMIQNLSDFLRGTLKKDEQQLVKFSEELTHLELYLEIEKVRFGHRLDTNITNDENSLQCKLPALLLQPIVENAIKFGLYDTTEKITITIRSFTENNQLNIVVTNPFDTATAGSNKGVGFGLQSVHRRLYLLYARQDLLQTQQQGNQFITIIKIPQGI